MVPLFQGSSGCKSICARSARRRSVFPARPARGVSRVRVALSSTPQLRHHRLRERLPVLRRAKNFPLQPGDQLGDLRSAVRLVELSAAMPKAAPLPARGRSGASSRAAAAPAQKKRWGSPGENRISAPGCVTYRRLPKYNSTEL